MEKNEGWKNIERHVQTILIAIIAFIAQDMYQDWKAIKDTVVSIAANDHQQSRDIHELRQKVFAVLPKNPTDELIHTDSKR